MLLIAMSNNWLRLKMSAQAANRLECSPFCSICFPKRFPLEGPLCQEYLHRYQKLCEAKLTIPTRFHPSVRLSAREAAVCFNLPPGTTRLRFGRSGLLGFSPFTSCRSIFVMALLLATELVSALDYCGLDRPYQYKYHASVRGSSTKPSGTGMNAETGPTGFVTDARLFRLF